MLDYDYFLTVTHINKSNGSLFVAESKDIHPYLMHDILTGIKNHWEEILSIAGDFSYKSGDGYMQFENAGIIILVNWRKW